MPGRSFTREFKLEIVRQLARGEKRPAQICREQGLAESVLARWRKEYAERGEAAFASQPAPHEALSAEARIAELERFCGQLALENAVRKKSRAELTSATGCSIAQRHTMIAAVQQAFPDLALRQLCRWLGVSRSWYSARPSAQERAARNVALRDAIEHLILEFPGYGYRRVTRALQREGWDMNHKRVLRIMRQESLLCHLKRRFVVTTDSAHGYAAYPNLLATTAVSAPDQVWVADITSVRLPSSFVYLACLLDAYSRRCIGWKLSRQIDTRLTLDALALA